MEKYILFEEYTTDGKKHVIYFENNGSTSPIETTFCFYCKHYDNRNGICLIYNSEIGNPLNMACTEFEYP